MENESQPNEDTNTENQEEQQENQSENTGSTENTEAEGPEDKPTRARRKKASPCPDCVNRHGVSTGLKGPSTLCPTCEGSGTVTVV